MEQQYIDWAAAPAAGGPGAAMLDAPEAPADDRADALAEATPADDTPADDTRLHEARLWIDNGWTARVVKNEDDDGWAVSMTRDGEREPALVGPWTMGRDKKNPKPLDTSAFNTLVKTASEVIRRHEQALHAAMHKQHEVATEDGRVLVTLDIVPDEYDPHAILAARDEFGDPLAHLKVRPDFKLTKTRAEAWVESGYAKP